MCTLARKIRITLFLLFVSSVSFAQQLNLKDTIPFDAQVKTGTLANGLKYYVRHNEKPEQKAELRLVVNAGSILEDETQQGIAHLNEHMAFNGTTHFKKNEIISFLQDIGVGFGNDLNAYTSFDETVYMLPIPTDKQGNIEKGFQVLQDWAHNVTFLDEDIQGERPIVLEESRNGKGAEDRMFRKIYPRLLAGSKYADRLPIGIDSIIKNTPADEVRRFYKEWYRPNLMAVIVVGDIDVNVAESMIKKYFGSLTNPPNARERVYAPVYPYDSSSGIIVTDKEATDYSVAINYPVTKKGAEVTLNDYRESLIRNIFISLLNQRLQEQTQKENPPFIYGGVGFESFARGYESLGAYAGAGTGDIKKAAEALVTEIARVKRFGFTAAELDRAKKNMLSSYENMYNNREKTPSSSYVGEYIRNFLQQEPSPGIVAEYDYAKQMLPNITLAEVNAVSNSFNDAKKFVYVTGPRKDDANLPDAQALLAVIDSASTNNITAYEEAEVESNLIPVLPRPGKILSRTKNTVLGTTELLLSNGVTVTLKSTDFNNNQVVMGATRKGGKNIHGLADKYSADYATSVVSAMGIGNFSPTELKKALAGKSVSVSVSLGNVTEGVSGSSSVKDLETLFKLTYLQLTSPRIDSSLFNSFIQKNKSQYQMLLADPTAAFVDTVYKVLYNNNPLAPSPVPNSSDFDKIDLAKAVSIYKQHFGNANNMNFVFVGKFTEAEIIPYILQYLAALPSDKTKKPYFIDNKVRPVEGKKQFTVYKGSEPKSMIVALYNGKTMYSEALSMKADALSEVLNILIIEELREKVQGIYGGGTNANVSLYPYPNYSFVLQLPCNPDKVDTLLQVAKREFKDMATKGPSLSYLKKVKAQWLEQNKTAMKENGTWLSQLLEYKIKPGNPDRFIHFAKYVNALTTTDVQQAAKLIFGNGNELIAVLRPELAK